MYKKWICRIVSGNQSKVTTDNSKKEQTKETTSNVTPISNLFDKTSSYEVHRDKIKDILVSAGFTFVSFEGPNSANYIFEEFRYNYSPIFQQPYYIKSLSFDKIKSYATYEKLYKLMGCEQSTDGRQCTKFEKNKSCCWWFTVSIN
ncbi:MAG: hypothetical protein WDM90_01320 [Ferruginibacter sp.]